MGKSETAARRAALATLVDYVGDGEPVPNWLEALIRWVLRRDPVGRVIQLRASNKVGYSASFFDQRMAVHGAPMGWDQEVD